jgi:hypothetical protein
MLTITMNTPHNFTTQSHTQDLEKVGVYGFITDGDSGDSVLANNPDLSTDAGQFAMIESVTTTDTSVTFEFVAAIPKERVSSLARHLPLLVH